MISFLFFFSFFFLLVKSHFYVVDLFWFSFTRRFMLRIVPLVVFFLTVRIFTQDIRSKQFLLRICFLLALFFSSFSFLVTDPFYFLLFLELTVIPMSISILLYSRDEGKIISLIFILFINLMGSIPFIFFCRQLKSFFSALSQHSMLVLFTFILVLICKLPVFLFHFWLTKAHVRASALISMLLARIMLKLASFGLLKFSGLFYWSSFTFLVFMFSLVLWGMLFFLVYMGRSFDRKLIVASSSVVHIGLIWPCVLNGSFLCLTPRLFMMTGHGLVSYLLFYLVRLIYECSQSRTISFNKSLECVSRTLAMIFFVYIFLNLGLPPFVGLLSEYMFCGFLYSFCFLYLGRLGVAMFVSIIFVMFFLTKKFFGKKFIFSVHFLSPGTLGFSFLYLGPLTLLPYLL